MSQQDNALEAIAETKRLLAKQAVEKPSGGAMRRWKTAQNAHLLACKLRFLAAFRLAWHPPETCSTTCKAERKLKAAQRRTTISDAVELEVLRQEVRSLCNRSSSLSATLNRDAIERTRLSYHNRDNCLREN